MDRQCPIVWLPIKIDLFLESLVRGAEDTFMVSFLFLRGRSVYHFGALYTSLVLVGSVLSTLSQCRRLLVSHSLFLSLFTSPAMTPCPTPPTPDQQFPNFPFQVPFKNSSKSVSSPKNFQLCELYLTICTVLEIEMETISNVYLV